VSGFDVDAHREGVRLDVAVAEHLGCSRSRAAARIAADEVLVDARPTTKQHRLRSGERVEVLEAAPAPAAPAPALPPVRFEDEHLLVVAKPAGLVVHPGAGHPDGTLVRALAGAGYDLAPAGGEGRPGIVHRLDRDTSGLLVVARTDAAHAGLVAAMRDRQVTRRYLALVRGVPSATRGRIDAPIGRDPAARTRFAVVRDGKPAVTRYRVLGRGQAPVVERARAELALLRCRLETGRTHQIRVHLTTYGHPIVGDPTYGAAGDVARALGLERPFLHAVDLAFDHPVSGQRVRVTEPLPADLTAALERAQLVLPDDVDPAGPADPADV
jgi:23S rRNA pseudouridine1911/1915/1917 synthase